MLSAAQGGHSPHLSSELVTQKSAPGENQRSDPSLAQRTSCTPILYILPAISGWTCWDLSVPAQLQNGSCPGEGGNTSTDVSDILPRVSEHRFLLSLAASQSSGALWDTAQNSCLLNRIVPTHIADCSKGDTK